MELICQHKSLLKGDEVASDKLLSILVRYVCISVCVCVCRYVCVCVCVCVCVSKERRWLVTNCFMFLSGIYAYLCLCVCMYVCVCVSNEVASYKLLSILVRYLCISLFVCVYVCMCVRVK